MNGFCDLHTHSVFSDGTCTPAELLGEALALHLSAVALCDHNTADGLPDFLAAAEGKPIEAVAGAEFSVELEGKELHLLGLFLPPYCFSQIADLSAEADRLKEESNLALISALQKAGIFLDYEAVKSRTPKGRVNRAHIAAEMTAKGYTASVKEAFSRYLAPEVGYYTEPKRLGVWEMIDFIRSVGACPVLAHPFLNLTEAELAAFLPKAREAGLVGMECIYSLYSEETTQKSLALAEHFGLKPSGGSDFHGTVKPDIRLGTGKGNLRVPYAWLSDLKAAV